MLAVEQELLELCGRDARALILISACYDAAQTDQPVDVEGLRLHMFATDDVKLRASLDFIAICLPRYISEWEHSRDIRDGLEADYLRQILNELFKLRYGTYPCDYCGGGTVTTLRPWLTGWHECAACHERLIVGRPRLRAVS